MDYCLPAMGPTKLRGYLSTTDALLFLNYMSFPKVGEYVHVKVGSVIELFSVSGQNKYYVTYDIHCKLLNSRITSVLSNDYTDFRPVRSENFRLPDVTSGSSTSFSPYLSYGRSNNTNRGEKKRQCIHYIHDKNEQRRQCRLYAIHDSSYCHVHNNRH